MTKIIKDIKQSLDTIRNFMINEVAIDGVPYLPPNTKGLLEIKENEVKLRRRGIFPWMPPALA